MNAVAVSGYRILDEPSPGPLSRFVVDPFWPLLSLMLGGAWIAWPWFAFNSFALGSATRLREMSLLAGAVATPVALVLSFNVAMQSGLLMDAAYPYARIALYVGKVIFAYLLFIHQARSLGLFEYFEGRPRNGILVVAGAMFLSSSVDELLGRGMLRLVMQ